MKCSQPPLSLPVVFSIRMSTSGNGVLAAAGASMVPVACPLVIGSGPNSAPRGVITRALAISTFTVSPASSAASSISATEPGCTVSPAEKRIRWLASR